MLINEGVIDVASGAVNLKIGSVLGQFNLPNLFGASVPIAPVAPVAPVANDANQTGLNLPNLPGVSAQASTRDLDANLSAKASDCGGSNANS